MYVFIFFKQMTAYEMRIRDWSSDVCSSDLTVTAIANAAKSRVKGIEFEGSAVLTDGFILNVGYSLNDAKYRDAVFSAYNVENADISGFTGGDASGTRIQKPSKHTFKGGAQFTAPAFPGFHSSLHTDYIKDGRAASRG